MTITANRADLAWLLGAVIPHVHKTAAHPWAVVGLATVGPDELVAYAGDGYSAVMARVPLGEGEGDLQVTLSARPSLAGKGEANDLLRYVKPSTVAEREGSVELLATGHELHVGLADDSAVYEAPLGRAMPGVAALLRNVNRMPDDHGSPSFSPDLLARFASAKREPTDCVSWFPKRKEGKRYGAMVVTIGANFIGAIAGMTNEAGINPSDVIASFLEAESDREAA